MGEGIGAAAAKALGDPDIAALPGEGPTYLELRARGDRRSDEADFLAFAAWMLRLAGFESAPADTHPPAHEIILPAGWRDLPIVRRALGVIKIDEGGAASGSPDRAGIAVTGVSAVSAPSGDLAGACDPAGEGAA